MSKRAAEIVVALLTLLVASRVVGELGSPPDPSAPGDGPVCIAASAFPAEADPTEERDSHQLEIAPGRLQERCGPHAGKGPKYHVEPKAFPYWADPIHASPGPCAASMRALLTAWLDEQVRDPLNPQRHVATREGHIGSSSPHPQTRLITTWTTEPGELLDEPVYVDALEMVNHLGWGVLSLELEVQSLEGATAAEAEPVLEQIVRKGLRTSGTTSWNGVMRPYVMRLTHYNSAADCAPAGKQDEARCAPPLWGEPIGGDDGGHTGDCLVQGLVGQRAATDWELTAASRASMGRLLERVHWAEVVHVRRHGTSVYIRLERGAGDEAYLTRIAQEDWRSPHEERHLAAQIERTRRKHGPD